MAASTFVKNNTLGQITVRDGSGGHTLVMKFDQGDFSVGPIMTPLRARVAYQRRGKFKSLGLGERVFPTGSFTACITALSDTNQELLADLLLGTGGFVGRTSTLGASHPVPTFDIDFQIEGTDVGDTKDHTFTCEDCDIQIDSIAEGDPDVISFSFTVYGDITGDIAATE